MNGFVVDASVALGWVLRDEESAEADRILLLARNAEVLAPANWPFEVANALLVAQRRRRISKTEARHALCLFAELGIGIEESTITEIPRTWNLAEDHRLSVYDAAYLDLAMRQHIPLATFDSELRRAAATTGVELLA